MASKQLNVSVTKQSHAFSKSSRFPSLYNPTKKVDPTSYNIRNKFDLMGTATDQSFKVKEGRFRYYHTKDKEGQRPDPASYMSPSSFRGKQEYSFGVSRSNMTSMFIDTVHKFKSKNKESPSPASYRSPSTITEGVKYSMRPKFERYGEKEENFSLNYLKRQKKLPGPGSYDHLHVTVGMNSVSSRIENNRKTAFAKASDRWEARAQFGKTPAPDNYQPKASMNENVSSLFKKNSMTKFGQDFSSIHDVAEKVNKFVPGPGSYNRFSEFDNTR